MKKKAPNRKILPLLMVVLGSLMLLGSLVVLYNIPETVGVTPTPTQAQLIIPYPQVNRISLGDAKAAYDLGDVIFIDTRGDDAFSQGHIPGAFSITDGEILSELNQFSPDDWIITYCT
jgi:3-mercaptopyruvate sulfurtransferase SseA